MKIDPNSLRNKHVLYSSKLADQIHDVESMLLTVDFLRKKSDFYTKKFSNEVMVKNHKEGNSNYDDDDLVMILSVTASTIIEYGKLFDKNSGARKLVLKSDIFNDNQDLLKNHENLIKARDKHIAHEDDLFGLRPKVLIGLDNEGVVELIPDKPHLRPIGHPGVERDKIFPLLERIETVLKHIIADVNNRIITEEFPVVYQNCEEFFEKLLSGESVNQVVIEKWRKKIMKLNNAKSNPLNNKRRR